MQGAEVAIEGVTGAQLDGVGVVGGGEAVGDEALVIQVVVEQLQLGYVAIAAGMGDVGIGGAGGGVGEIPVADENRAAVELGGPDPGVEGEARVRRRLEAEIAGDQAARSDLVRRQPAVAVEVLQGGVAAGDVGPVSLKP